MAATGKNEYMVGNSSTGEKDSKIAKNVWTLEKLLSWLQVDFTSLVHNCDYPSTFKIRCDYPLKS